MASKVIYTVEALKDMRKLPAKTRQRILDKVKRYAEAPADITVKRLKNSRYLRLRIGDYRVVFAEGEGKVTVVFVDHRRNIYRRLK